MAQAPVVGSADPESLFTSKDPKLHANKQVVMHIMRDISRNQRISGTASDATAPRIRRGIGGSSPRS